MERRYELRLEQMPAQAEVSPELMRGLFDRLEAFAEPLARSLDQPEQRRHSAESMTGLLPEPPRKSGDWSRFDRFLGKLSGEPRDDLKVVSQAYWTTCRA